MKRAGVWMSDSSNKRAKSATKNYHNTSSNPTLPEQRHQLPNARENQLVQKQRVNNENVPIVRLLTTEREEDPHRLAQRQKQIDFGKNTLGYDRYCQLVPR